MIQRLPTTLGSLNQVLNLLKLYFLKKPTINIFISFEKQLNKKKLRSFYFTYSYQFNQILFIIEQQLKNQNYIENIFQLLYNIDSYFISTDFLLNSLNNIKKILNITKFQLYFIATKNFLQINHLLLKSFFFNFILINFINIHNFYKFISSIYLLNKTMQINFNELYLINNKVSYFLNNKTLSVKKFIFKNLGFLLTYLILKKLIIEKFEVSTKWFNFSIDKLLY